MFVVAVHDFDPFVAVCIIAGAAYPFVKSRRGGGGGPAADGSTT